MSTFRQQIPSGTMESGTAGRRWKLMELLKKAAELFERNGIESPRLNAELLLGKAIGMDRIQLYLNFDRPISPDELNRFRELTRRRLRREPLQYILEKAEFMGLEFKVNRHVLCPRPETETLVEWVIEACRARNYRTVLDVGTGSGNIAVALAYHLPEISVTGWDVSAAAIAVAQENALRHIGNGRVRFQQIDLFGEDVCAGQPRYDVLVSNPPYISPAEFEALEPEVRVWEPREALLEGEKPFRFYRRLAEVAPALLRPQGAIFVEVGAGKARNVAALFQNAGFVQIGIREDLAGIERVVKAVLPARM
jgi:release factor glutamine methyltransferase